MKCFGLEVEANEAVPQDHVWMVSPTGVRVLYNIGIDVAAEDPTPELKIGDWPWPSK